MSTVPINQCGLAPINMEAHDEQGNFPTLADQWLQTFGQPDNQLPSIEVLSK